MPKKKGIPNDMQDSGSVNTGSESLWIIDIPDSELNNKYTKRIINFYLFHTPVQDKSALSRPLSSYGWTDPWNAPEYLNRRLANIISNNNFLIEAPRITDMRTPLQSAGLLESFPGDPTEEKICIYAGNDSQYYSVLKHIRNCFAHGRFSIIKKGRGYDVFYIFEDITASNSKNISARMILKQSTLLKWIDVIEKGP